MPTDQTTRGDVAHPYRLPGLRCAVPVARATTGSTARAATARTGCWSWVNVRLRAAGVDAVSMAEPRAHHGPDGDRAKYPTKGA
jgi:hypothetical protein